MAKNCIKVLLKLSNDILHLSRLSIKPVHLHLNTYECVLYALGFYFRCYMVNAMYKVEPQTRH